MLAGHFFRDLRLEEYAVGLEPFKGSRERGLCRFLFGTVLDDFSLESPVICPDPIF